MIGAAIEVRFEKLGKEGTMRQWACLAMGVVIGVSLWTAGCEESSTSTSRRARLVADENLQLKQQLKACRAEVEEQKRMVVDAQKQAEQIASDSGEANIKLLKALADMGKQLEAMSAENERLKAQLKAAGIQGDGNTGDSTP